MDLDELLRRFVADGDGAAMEELVRRTRPGLLRVARRIGAPQDADDAVQAAYLALVRRAATALEAPVRAWLLTAVVRIAYRNKAVAKRRVAAANRLGDWAGRETPLDATIRRDETAALRREVTRLPEHYRDALVLHHLEGLPVEDVAALLDVSVSAVKMRLSRGRTLLRSRLGIRLGYAVLWLPWTLTDARAAPFGGVLVKKVAFVLMLAMVVGTTLVVVQHARKAAPPSRASAPMRDSATMSASTMTTPTDSAPAHADGRTRRGFISGRVVDESGAPLREVGVFVRQYDADPPGSRIMRFFYPYEIEPNARSEASGDFVVHDPLERVESVWLVKPGYGAAWFSTDARGIEGLEVVLKRDHRAEGMVLDTEGHPIAGARVFFSMPGAFPLAVHSDGGGRYAFDILPPPPWRRMADAPGYEQFSDPTQASIMQAGDLHLVRNTVIVDPADEADGTPMAEARGRLLHAASGGFLAQLVPGFEDPRLPDVRYPKGRLYAYGLTVPKGGRSEADVQVFAPGYLPSTIRIELTPGEEPPHLHPTLRRGLGELVLEGRVEGAAAARIDILLADRAGTVSADRTRTLIASIDTDRDGRFVLHGLPAGSYRMIVSAEGGGLVTREVDLPARDIVIVMMEPTARLDVVGVAPDGTPVEGAWIHVEADGGRVWERQTDAEGCVVFPTVPTGKLLVSPARFHGFTARHSGVPFEEIEIRPGDSAELRVEIPVERDFTLCVADGAGERVTGIAVTLEPVLGFVTRIASNVRPKGVTNSGGEIRLRLHPGTYEATILRNGITHTARFDVGPAQSHRIVVTEDSVLRGRVVDALTGEPIGNIRVQAMAGETVAGSALTDGRDGRFGIACAGNVTLNVWALQGPNGTVNYETPYPFLARREVEVATSGEVVVELPQVRGKGADLPVGLDVRVTDGETGSALDGARVSCTALRNGFWMAATDWIETGSDGRVSIHVILGDAYQVHVLGPEGGNLRYAMRDMECAAGPTVTVDAALSRQAK